MTKTKYLIYGAMIAAIYFVLTYAVAPISSGLFQCRVSEALCILPYFTPAAVPGLFVGCLTANLLMGSPIYDVVFGSAATLLAAILTRQIAQQYPTPGARWLIPAPAVLLNALVVGWILSNVYDVGAPYWVCASYVALGQIGACYVLGMPLLFLLERYKDKLF